MSDNQKLEREKLIHKYVTSLDNGDMDGVKEVLDAALYDPELERIINEIDLSYQEEEEGVTPIANDAELVRKLAREHLHSAFDPLPDNPLDFSIIKDRKNLQEVTVGNVALMLKKADRIPTKDRDKIELLLSNQTIIPKNKSIKDIRKLFESLDVTYSDRFLDIFRVACIKTSMHIGLRNSSFIQTEKV